VIRLIRDHDVRRLVSFPGAVEVVARGITSRRGAAERSTARFDAGWLRVMSGTLPEQDVLGFKAFHLIPGAGVRYLVALYRLSDGEPLALLDGNYVTVARTSAAAAAAAQRYFGSEPMTVGIIGSGTLARDGLRALASVCRVQTARVYSRSAPNRQRYAAELGTELGTEVVAADTTAAATEGATMILCATQTGGVVALTADDVGDARYISSVSSTLPVQRELDEHVIASAALVVIDTPDALAESGDLLAARELGLDPKRTMLLADYLPAAPPSDRTPVVYKSIGSVEQDLALAAAIWSAAERDDIGERIDAIESPRL
jgi:ornithine cyclodeaminase/alanine dehydrogenase-like protein (mu-crystallin family)